MLVYRGVGFILKAVVFVTLVVIIGTFGAAGIDELFFFFVIVNFVLFLAFSLPVFVLKVSVARRNLFAMKMRLAHRL